MPNVRTYEELLSYGRWLCPSLEGIGSSKTARRKVASPDRRITPRFAPPPPVITSNGFGLEDVSQTVRGFGTGLAGNKPGLPMIPEPATGFSS